MPTLFLVDSEKQKLRTELQALNLKAIDNVFFEIERLEERVKQLEGPLADFWKAIKAMPSVESPKYLPTLKK